MRRVTVIGLLLFAVASSSCRKSSPEAKPASEVKPAQHKSLREVVLGTWTVHEIKGKGRRDFTAIYTADGVNENQGADGRSSKEQYRVLDERTIEYVGPPAV